MRFQRTGRALLGALALGCLLGGPALAGVDEKQADLSAEKQELIRATFERMLDYDYGAFIEETCAVKAGEAEAACGDDKECQGLSCDCMPPAEMLAYYAEKDARVFAVIAPQIQERVASKKTSAAHRERMLDLLAWCGSNYEAQKLGTELFEKQPKSFTTDQVLAFAEQGLEPFSEKVESLAKKDVRAAAYMAMHGDYAAKKTLLKAVKSKSLDDGGLCDAMIASVALSKLGDEEHLAWTQKRVKEEVLAALDAGETERARRIALEAEFLYEALAGKKAYGLGLSYLPRKLDFHCATRSGEVASADQVFELIERISPI
ncbi:MAG: hypothetical protein O7B99_09675 [Planctomycetota bacterium]|nr:hypothetical protein [Planctomycetota bacterium]